MGTQIIFQRDSRLNSPCNSSNHPGRRLGEMFLDNGLRLLGILFWKDGDESSFVGNVQRVQSENFAGTADIFLYRDGLFTNMDGNLGGVRDFNQPPRPALPGSSHACSESPRRTPPSPSPRQPVVRNRFRGSSRIPSLPARP